MNSAKSLLLACTAMGAALAVTLAVTPSIAATPEAPFAAGQNSAKDSALMFAQAPALTPAQIEEQKKKAAEDAAKRAAPPAPPAARPAPAPAAPPPPAARPAAPPPPPQAPAVRPAAPPPPPAAQQRPAAPPPPPAPAAQDKPATPPAPPPAAQRPAAPPPPPAAAQDKPATPPAPPAGAQDRQRGDRGDMRRPDGQRGPGAPGGPGAQGRPGTPPPPAASTTSPAPAAKTAPAPAGATPPPPAAAQDKPATSPTAPAAGATPSAAPATPPAAQAPVAAPAPSAARTAAPPALAAPPPPPAAVRNANEFIRGDRGGRPSRGIDDVRRTRQESRDGDRVIIREGDRTIVRGADRTIIQHNDSSRFAIGARTVRTETRGDQRVTVVERPGGVRILSYSDRDGRMVRRVRRDRDGRETVLIDNLFAGAVAGLFLSALQPPVVRMPRETYIVDGYRADRREIYEVFVAPPVERLEQRYTLDQVRYNAPLREYMRRVDLDVNFDTGSWQLTPQQIDRLAAVADGLNQAIAKNPREIFLIEGHTDTVGNNDDNLSLSDRRAEAVAVALTERFRVPGENLVTQGYGEDYPKELVDGPSRVNRRVAVRRITPLLDQTAQQ